MANCPVCETEYTENEVETCAVCGYDLTPLWFLDKPPDVFLEKERKRIAAAKRVWQLSQSQVQSAQLMVSQLQSQLEGMTQTMNRLTESQNQRLVDFQSQLDGIVERIDRLNKKQNQQQLNNMKSQLDEMNRQIRNLNESQSLLNFSELLSRIDRLNKEQNQQQLNNMKLLLDEIIPSIGSLIQSQLLPSFADLLAQIDRLNQKQNQQLVEAIASRLKPTLETNSDFDYTQLDRLLKSGNWKDADKETARMMLAVARQTERGYLDEDDIKNFPCEDLRIIDGLWVKYSNGHFGFSVQKQIYINCGGKPDGSYPGDTIWERYCDLVGLRVNGSYISRSVITFSASAPRGHLPVGCLPPAQRNRKAASSLFSRAQTCNL